MTILEPGHIYTLSNVNPDTKNDHSQPGEQTLSFVMRFRGDANHPGTLNQEVLRALIDRVKFLDREQPWEGNKDILYHLRMALVLHESRALFRKVEKGELEPEHISTDRDGHYLLNLLKL